MPNYSKKAAAALAGMHSAATDAVKYPALGANWAMNKVGLRSDEDAQSASKAIKDLTNQPPYISDHVQGFIDEATEENPYAKIAGGLVTPGGAKQALSLRGLSKSQDEADWSGLMSSIGNAAVASGRRSFVQQNLEDMYGNNAYAESQRQEMEEKMAMRNMSPEERQLRIAQVTELGGGNYKQGLKQLAYKKMEAANAEKNRYRGSKNEHVPLTQGAEDISPEEDNDYFRSLRQAISNY